MNKPLIVGVLVFTCAITAYQFAKIDARKPEQIAKLKHLEHQTECTSEFIGGTTESLIQKYLSVTQDIGGYKSIKDMDEQISNLLTDIKKIDDRLNSCTGSLGYDGIIFLTEIKTEHNSNIKKIKSYKEQLQSFKNGSTLVCAQYPKYMISLKNGWKYDNGYYSRENGKSGFIPMNYISGIKAPLNNSKSA